MILTTFLAPIKLLHKYIKLVCNAICLQKHFFGKQKYFHFNLNLLYPVLNILNLLLVLSILIPSTTHIIFLHIALIYLFFYKFTHKIIWDEWCLQFSFSRNLASVYPWSNIWSFLMFCTCDCRGVEWLSPKDTHMSQLLELVNMPYSKERSWGGLIKDTQMRLCYTICWASSYRWVSIFETPRDERKRRRQEKEKAMWQQRQGLELSTSQEHQVPPERSWKRQEGVLHQSAQGDQSPAQFQTSGLQNWETNFCCFKPLNLWWFVWAALEN